MWHKNPEFLCYFCPSFLSSRPDLRGDGACQVLSGDLSKYYFFFRALVAPNHSEMGWEPSAPFAVMCIWVLLKRAPSSAVLLLMSWAAWSPGLGCTMYLAHNGAAQCPMQHESASCTSPQLCLQRQGILLAGLRLPEVTIHLSALCPGHVSRTYQ